MFRGRTDYTMYILAFIVGIFIFILNNTILEFDTDFGIQVLVCTAFSTLM
jgi:hypothetical protein